MRLFLAIELPDDVRRHLAELQDNWRERCAHAPGKISWTRPENFHITLRFFGEVAEPQVPLLTSALQSAPFGAPIHLRAHSSECFPPRGNIRVITAAMNGDLERLSRLYDELTKVCDPLGYPAERRPYRPHVTIGRPRSPLPSPFRATFADPSLFPGPTFDATQFTLFQSQLRSGGSQYVPLARFP